ncbi:MAG: prepilin-type N-terminal cleavage/methylation domain-containing protein, partial [Proteobacteria bacterium]|nr:prepilin-type N-terminal cleavage/methylation domain-containing protein [Pseudomonadota bacterium]
MVQLIFTPLAWMGNQVEKARIRILVTGNKYTQGFTLIPNPDIENTMIAQVLNAPKKSSKSLITNEVHLVFDDSLCTSSTCTLKCVSISGFTLIEILIVVVLVSILTVMGVQMLSSG